MEKRRKLFWKPLKYGQEKQINHLMSKEEFNKEIDFFLTYIMFEKHKSINKK